MYSGRHAVKIERGWQTSRTVKVLLWPAELKNVQKPRTEMQKKIVREGASELLLGVCSASGKPRVSLPGLEICMRLISSLAKAFWLQSEGPALICPQCTDSEQRSFLRT